MKKFFTLLTVTVLAVQSAIAKEMPNVPKEIIESWQGATLDEIMKQWGYPDGEQFVAGRRVYFWANQNSISTVQYNPNATGPFTPVATVATNSGVCKRFVEVDDKYNVVQIRMRGACPGTHYDPYYLLYVNPEKSYFKLKKEAKEKKRQERLQRKLQEQKIKNQNKKDNFKK